MNVTFEYNSISFLNLTHSAGAKPPN